MPILSGVRKYMLMLWLAMPLAVFSQSGEKMVWGDAPMGMRVEKSSREVLQVHITVPAASFLRKEVEGEAFVALSLPGMSHGQSAGYPDLPLIRRLIVIPGGGEASVEKVTFHTRRIALHDRFSGAKLFPVQPSLPKRDLRQPQPLIWKQEAYRRNTWMGDSLVSLHTLGTLRGRKLAILTVAPFRYNPVRDLLEVYDEVEVTLRFSGGTTAKSAATLSSPVFNSLGSSFLNDDLSAAGKGLVEAPVRYVILTDTLLRGSLGDFTDWKRQTGYKVEVICKGDPGVGSTVDSMKAYLRDLYLSATPDNPAPSFLLIVGDTPQIPPAANPGRVTDLYYATYDGPDDYLPDLYYGRIPARDTNELKIMLDKILEYEKYAFPDPSYLQEAVMVAGVDGTYASRWGNGQINYATDYYVNAAHGYNPHIYLYPASGSSDQQIIDDISSGVSLVNYTGHGLSSGWQDPTFNTGDIPDLQNAHKYPLIITNGCETATFGLDECFAEALVRARNKGAVAYIGCSDDSYWDEDYYWAVGVGPIVAKPLYEETSLAAYDRLFHDHGEPPEEWYITADQIIFAGNLQVTEGNPSRARLYWEIYNLMGDPSMMPWLAVPLPLTIHVPSAIPAGTSSLTVVTEPYSYLSLMRSGKPLATALAGDDGTVVLTFNEQNVTGKLLLTVTRQNRIPYVDTLTVVSDTLPYIRVEQILTDDSACNANGLPDNGEELFLDVTIKNAGSREACAFTGRLSSESPWVEVTDSLTGTLSLAGNGEMLLRHAFRYRVEDSIPDAVRVTFHISFSDTAGNHWDHWFTQILNAPVPVIRKIRIVDIIKGNGNYRLDPGEQVDFLLQLANEGHAPLPAGHALFSLTDSLVTQAEDSSVFAEILPGEMGEVPFSTVIDTGAPYGAMLQITADIFAGDYFLSDTFSYPLGLVYEDFETGDFSAYPWQNDPDIPWVVTGDLHWRGDFSAASGDIGHSQSSALEILCDVAEEDSISFYYKVSSETGYDFLRFSIDGTEMDKWSGEKSWTRVVYPVNAGSHTFSWTYYKDANTSMGLDKAWVDFVVFPAGSFSGVDAGITELLAPVSGTGLAVEPVTVVVRNFGEDDLQGIPLSYSVNGAEPVQESLSRQLASGDTAHYTFSVPVDMSVLKTYHLLLKTELGGDQGPLNNAITVTVTHEGTIDVVVDSLVSPGRDSVYDAYEKISVSVINASSGAVDSLPLWYRVNEASPVFQAFDTLLAAGDTAQLQFPGRVDMADTGEYVITVYTAIPGDIDPSNDTVTVYLYNKVMGSGKPLITGKVILYPNPAGERIILKPSFPGNAWNLTVMDMKGRICLVRENLYWSAGEEITIPLRDLAAGAYFILFTDGQRKISLPFVKR